MGDEEREDFNQEEPREEKVFELREAEGLLPVLTPLVSEAVEQKKVAEHLEEEFSRVQNRILLYGGVLPPLGLLSEKKVQRDACVSKLRQVLEQIEQTGCVVKDLERGLIDFRSVVNNEQVYLCWKLGEQGIRFYHRIDEGFAGRKPLRPSDPGSSQGPKPN